MECGVIKSLKRIVLVEHKLLRLVSRSFRRDPNHVDCAGAFAQRLRSRR
jgi:hypothetical protein